LFGEISATLRFGTATTSANAERSPARSRNNNANVGPHGGSVIWALFEVQVGARASPLHRFPYGFVLSEPVGPPPGADRLASTTLSTAPSS
jgi:hypothetical protein